MPGFGLRLARSQGMEGYTGNLNDFPIDPTNTDAIFTGDVVAFDANGFIIEATGAADNDDFTVLGVFMGCQYVDSNGDYKFRNQWDGGANKSEIMANIALPVTSNFYIKGTLGETYDQSDIGTRKGIVYAAGNTMYGDSRITLGAAGATIATAPLMVHRLAPLPNNTFDSEEPIFEVSVVRQQITFAAA